MTYGLSRSHTALDLAAVRPSTTDGRKSRRLRKFARLREVTLQELLERLEKILGEGFRLERELGGGGVSRVFLVHVHSMARQMLRKVLLPEHVTVVSERGLKRMALVGTW